MKPEYRDTMAVVLTYRGWADSRDDVVDEIADMFDGDDLGSGQSLRPIERDRWLAFDMYAQRVDDTKGAPYHRLLSMFMSNIDDVARLEVAIQKAGTFVGGA